MQQTSTPTCQRDIVADVHGEQFKQCSQPAVGLANATGLIWLKLCGYHFGQAKRDGYRTRKLGR
jgi:hypothetical protein